MLLTRFNGWRAETPHMDAQLGPDKKFGAFTQLASVPFGAIAGDVIDLRNYCSPVENQLDLSSCVANATIGGLELLESVQGLPFVDLARLFTYYNTRLDMGEVDKDEGSIISLAMGTLGRHGVCSEAVWKYDVSNVFMRPSIKAYEDAFKHRLSNAYKITEAGDAKTDAIVTALRAKHPVVFGAIVYESFRTCPGPVVMPGGTALGRHAMLIVGVDLTQKVYIVKNSWDISWGAAGYCYFPFSYLNDPIQASDFWCPTLYA